ncbi:dihydrofolate reductase family protein [Conexibacter arvalis]|uniref:Dihydrofolate reductase n=1 Tax=Conexibacter arvalis TaxID=912552 RepID=A0A840IMB6_9ACTN|nr:dihydrofolate reductase family protein [Conexibacter arvalis]MBB4665098.1 dihydrofolate reductase [Conexibacter arvalis]
MTNATLFYATQVSLDGYMEAPGHDIGWTEPDAELHAYMNEMERSAQLSLFGRRLYELMESFWPSADEAPGAPDEVVEFARIWRETPKVVFSSTLERVTGNARLVRGDAAEEVAKIKRETKGTINVGGAHLAASLLRAGLLDELEAIVYPVVLGAGTPLLPELTDRVKLRHVATRTFESGVVSVRYRVDGR